MIGMDGSGRGGLPRGSRIWFFCVAAVCCVLVCATVACRGRRLEALPDLPSPEPAVFVMHGEEAFFSVFKKAMGLDEEESAVRRAVLVTGRENTEMAGDGTEKAPSEWMRQLQRLRPVTTPRLRTTTTIPSSPLWTLSVHRLTSSRVSSARSSGRSRPTLTSCSTFNIG